MEGYKPTAEDYKDAEKLMTDEQKKMSEERQIQLFLKGDLYKKEIEPFFNKETTLIEKTIFLARCMVTEPLYDSHLSASYLMIKNGGAYEVFIMNFKNQCKSEIRTPKDLDTFLKELVSIIGEINYGKRLHNTIKSLNVDDTNKMDEFNAIVGTLNYCLLDEIFLKHYMVKKKNKKDLEWMFTLGKYLYAASVVGYKLREIHENYDELPGFSALKNYFISNGQKEIWDYFYGW